MAGADPKQLTIGIELAIASALHLHIAPCFCREGSLRSRFLLGEPPAYAGVAFPGMAAYSHKSCCNAVNASPQQIAVAQLMPKDLASANAAVAEFGMMLRPEKRNVDSLTVSPAEN